MHVLTRAQRKALKAVYDRAPVFGPNNASEPKYAAVVGLPGLGAYSANTYRQFRRTARHSEIMGCLMVPWCGMWLGIESDGHTHS